MTKHNHPFLCVILTICMTLSPTYSYAASEAPVQQMPAMRELITLFTELNPKQKAKMRKRIRRLYMAHKEEIDAAFEDILQKHPLTKQEKKTLTALHRSLLRDEDDATPGENPGILETSLKTGALLSGLFFVTGLIPYALNNQAGNDGATGTDRRGRNNDVLERFSRLYESNLVIVTLLHSALVTFFDYPAIDLPNLNGLRSNQRSTSTTYPTYFSRGYSDRYDLDGGPYRRQYRLSSPRASTTAQDDNTREA